MNNEKNIVIVIVTYNALKWIEKCLKSVKDSSINSTIIIVDNNSTDATVLFLKDNFVNDVILIESKENLGFGKGNNLGIKKAITLNPDYVFLLNQDTIITPFSLEKLVNVASQNPEYGIISPVHLNYEGSELEYYFSNYVTTYKTPTFILDHVTSKNIKSIYETNFVNAAAWLVPKEVLSKVGGFDPLFWHYGEDDNYGQRIKYHGFKIGIVSNAFILHDSKERTLPSDYLFSSKYYLNYTKNILIKYGDINKEIAVRNFQIERNIIVYEVLNSLFRMNFKKAYLCFKKITLLKKAFSDITISREKNKNVLNSYLYLQ